MAEAQGGGLVIAFAGVEARRCVCSVPFCVRAFGVCGACWLPCNVKGFDDAKRFTTDEDDHAVSFTLAEFGENNAEDPEIGGWVKALDGLEIGECLVWNFGAGGQTMMKRVA